jgi:hypothetical protein
MKKAIELLEKARAEIKEESARSFVVGLKLGKIAEYVYEALAELKAQPRWETPEQWEKRTGEKWLDSWAVYALYENKDGTSQWFWGGYKKELDRATRHNKNPLNIVCATEAGPPPDDWRLEEKPNDIS